MLYEVITMDLALDDHRVDDVAEIVDRDEPLDLGHAGFGVDFELADVATVGIGESYNFV